MQKKELTFYANVRCKKTIAKKILCKIVLDKKKTEPIKGILLNFDTHFNYIYNKQTNEEIKFEELVAEFDIPKIIKTYEIKKYTNYLDDFLWLVSFAERRHCTCIGFETVCQERHTIFYKRDRIIPIREKHSDSELLIDISLFEKYINTVYSNFIHNKNKDLIRQAIQYTIGSEDKTIESAFKSLFSALETVLLYFRKEAKFETVLPNHDWLIFQKEIKKLIKLKKPSTKERRTLLYEKIPELNRITFASAFKKFCLDYKIDLKDLWPIIDNSEGISLLQLRNKLIHGELFSLEHLNSLATAKMHLRWIVERLILTLLGWPVYDSNVSEGYLIFYNPYKKWEVDRKVFQNC